MQSATWHYETSLQIKLLAGIVVETQSISYLSLAYIKMGYLRREG